MVYVEPLFDCLKRGKIRGEGVSGRLIEDMNEGGTMDILRQLRPVSMWGADGAIQVLFNYSILNEWERDRCIKFSCPPQVPFDITAINRAGRKTEDHWTNHAIGIGIGLLTRREIKVEFLHNPVVWVVILRMVGFVEDDETDIPSHNDISMSECIQQYLRCGHYDLVCAEEVLPKIQTFPLVGLIRARDNADAQGNIFL